MKIQTGITVKLVFQQYKINCDLLNCVELGNVVTNLIQNR